MYTPNIQAFHGNPSNILQCTDQPPWLPIFQWYILNQTSNQYSCYIRKRWNISTIFFERNCSKDIPKCYIPETRDKQYYYSTETSILNLENNPSLSVLNIQYLSGKIYLIYQSPKTKISGEKAKFSLTFNRFRPTF